MSDNLACAKDKFFAAAGAQYAACPKDYVLDEKIKFVPSPVTRYANVDLANPGSGSSDDSILSEIEHYWLHSDTVGGK